jgi:hypothetical protein
MLVIYNSQSIFIIYKNDLSIINITSDIILYILDFCKTIFKNHYLVYKYFNNYHKLYTGLNLVRYIKI